jgi:hypothetical protein
MYAAAQADLEVRGPETLRELGRATAALLERQTGWTPCQRAARMRTLVEAWQAARAGGGGVAVQVEALPPLYDLVVPLGTGSKREDLELRTLLRSAQVNLRGLRTVHVIGPRRPAWLLDHPGVRWHDWQPRVLKNHDIIEKFLYAASCAEVSEVFVGACDDWVFLRPAAPVASWGAVQRGGVLSTTTDQGYWKRAQAQTRALLEAAGKGVKFYDTHTPSVMTKAGWLQLEREIPWRQAEEHAVWSLYHNVAGVQGPTIGKDGLASCGWHAGDGSRVPESTAEVERACAQRLFLAANDAGWNEPLQAWLEERFPMPAPWEALPTADRERTKRTERTERTAGEPEASSIPAVSSVLSVPPPPSPVGEIRIRIPWRVDRDLGAFYNAEMEACPPGGWVLFLDHDCMVLTPDWYNVCLAAIAATPMAGLFTCRSNRGKHRAQRDGEGCRLGEDVAQHLALARRLAATGGAAAVRVEASSGWGFFMLVRRECWDEIGGFTAGFTGVDTRFSRRVARSRWGFYRLDGVYAYHAMLTTGPLAGGPQALAEEEVSGPVTIAAVVTTHAEPRYLTWCVEAMQSVDRQSRAPEERLLVIDGAEAEAPTPAYALEHGWTVARGQWRHPSPARNLAARSVSAVWVAYLDADNRWPTDYLRSVEPYLAAATSDVACLYGQRLRQFSAGQTYLWTPPERFDAAAKANCVDSGSLWRRSALLAQPWPEARHEDWSLARQLAGAGYALRRHGGLPYLYRAHEQSRCYGGAPSVDPGDLPVAGVGSGWGGLGAVESREPLHLHVYSPPAYAKLIEALQAEGYRVSAGLGTDPGAEIVIEGLPADATVAEVRRLVAASAGKEPGEPTAAAYAWSVSAWRQRPLQALRLARGGEPTRLRDTALLMCAFALTDSSRAAIRGALAQLARLEPLPTCHLLELVMPGDTLRLGDVSGWFPAGAYTHHVRSLDERYRGIFNKEAALNWLVANAGAEVPYCLLHDADVYPLARGWAARMRASLMQTPLVQGFRSYIDSEDPSFLAHSFAAARAEEWQGRYNPGLSWGLTRAFWEQAGGLNPWAAGGSGDNLMVAEFTRDKREAGYARMWPYCAALVRDLNGLTCERPGFVDCRMIHLHHGTRASRVYNQRHELLNHFLPLTEHLETDAEGFLRFRAAGGVMQQALLRRREITTLDDLRRVLRECGFHGEIKGLYEWSWR